MIDVIYNNYPIEEIIANKIISLHRSGLEDNLFT